jgi:hypothetical protein
MPQPNLIVNLKSILEQIVDLADSDSQVSAEVDEISALAEKALEELNKGYIIMTETGPIALLNAIIVDPYKRLIPGDPE